MNRLTIAVMAATMFGSAAMADMKKGTPESAPMDPPTTGGPSQGSNASMSTPSVKAAGKDAYARLDVDNDGAITKAEAAVDPALEKSFDRREQGQEDRRGRVRAFERQRQSGHGHAIREQALTHALEGREPREPDRRLAVIARPRSQMRSMTIAMPWPTPMHIVHSA